MTPREMAAKYAAAHPAAAPRQVPEEGVVIGRRKRPDKGELRLSRHEYNGRPYYRLALWDGAWPEKGKQIAIRESELADVVTWLCDAMETAK